MTTDKAPKPTTRWATLLEAMEKGNPVTLLELDLDRKAGKREYIGRAGLSPEPPEPPRFCFGCGVACNPCDEFCHKCDDIRPTHGADQ